MCMTYMYMLMCILVEARESQMPSFTYHTLLYFFEMEYLIEPGARLVAHKPQRSS